MKINDVLIKPVLTEKATQLSSNKVYTFEVNNKVNKFQIKQAIEKLYKVKVKEVKVVNRAGKIRRSGRKMTPKQLPNRKIAYVSLKEGKIDLFPQT